MPNETASIDPAVSTDSNPRVLIGICTLNEADNITPLIDRLRISLPTADILVVDDDSEDHTGDLVAQIAAQSPSVRLVVRTSERGLGSAIRYALQDAIRNGYDYFLNLDGDLSHDPDQLPRLLHRALESPQLDVVIGSRYVAGGSIVGWPAHRKLMSRMVNRFATLCLRLPVKDCSGSMRCYRVETLSQLGLADLKSNGYAVLEELLVMLHRHDAKFAEVPITFSDRRQGQSKLTFREAARSTLQMLMMAVRR